MATVTYSSRNRYTTTLDTLGNTGASIVLIGKGKGKAQCITDIILHFAGTISAYKIQVLKEDASTIIATIGGQTLNAAQAVGAGAVYSFTNPIVCAENDNATIVATVTGATNSTVGITANYTIDTL